MDGKPNGHIPRESAGATGHTAAGMIRWFYAPRLCRRFHPRPACADPACRDTYRAVLRMPPPHPSPPSGPVSDQSPVPGGDAGVRWRGALLVLFAALFYFLLFHRYGFFLQDEGVIAYQALRVSEGQFPYADFQTAYTPAGFYLHAILFKALTPSLVVLRAFAAFACAATAALLFLASCQVLRMPYALLPSLLYVLLEDQASHGLVVHTMAYPARYVTTLWLLSLCLTLSHAQKPRRALPILLGLTTAAITAFKHTAGVYNAWAVGLSLILVGLDRCRAVSATAPEPSPVSPGSAHGAAAHGWVQRCAGGIPAVFLMALLMALPVLFGGFANFDPAVTLVFVVPLACAVLGLLRTTWPRARNDATAERLATLSPIGRELLAFAAGAAVPSLLWLGYFGTRVGFGLMTQRLVLDGPAVARSYAIPFPAPDMPALAVLALAGIMGGVTACRRLGVLSRRTAVGVVTRAGFALALAWGLWTVIQVRSLIASGYWLAAGDVVGRGIDNAAFYLVPITAYALLPRLARWRREDRPLDLALLCWVHGLCQILLAYPRLDVAHLYEGLVVVLLVATLLLARTVSFVRSGSAFGTRWPTVVVVGVLMVAAVVKLAPRVDAQVTWHDGWPALAHRTALSAPRGGLYATATSDATVWFAALNRLITYVGKHTRPESPIFAYPALAGIYFLSERDNPTQMDYFHRGFGEGRDEVAVMTTLEEKQVQLVVTMEDPAFDPPEDHHFPILKDYLRRHFAQVERITPFQVLQRVAP